MPISTTYQPNAPVAKLGSGSAISNREDLSDILTILAPEETPLLSLCPKAKATSTFHEWTVDSLAAPSTAGINEGSDVTSFDDKFSDRARLGNYVQTFRRDYLVSNLQQAVTSVGPANVAQAEGKCMREIKRDIEATICSSNDRSVQNGADTPYALRGIGNWIQSAGPTDVPTAYRTPGASIVASATPTETQFNDIVGSIFGVNGEVNNLTLIAGRTLKRVISQYTRAESAAVDRSYQVTQAADTKKITFSVNVYDTDFGLVNIINGNAACMPAATTGYFVNPKYLGFATLIPLGSTRLENQGGGERGYVDMTGTLICRHPGAHGKITA